MSLKNYCLTCNKSLGARYKKKLCPCYLKSNVEADIKLQKDLGSKIDKFFSNKKKEETKKFEHGRTPIPLSIPTFNHEEVIESMQSLLSTFVTMGDKVKEFEKTENTVHFIFNEQFQSTDILQNCLSSCGFELYVNQNDLQYMDLDPENRKSTYHFYKTE